MRIAISSDNDRMLESSVSHHFGRCPFFTVVDLNNGRIEGVKAVENPYFNAHSPGQVPSFIRELGADVMLAGGMGRRAIDLFMQFGIGCSTGAHGSVKGAVESFLAGVLPEASPCRESVMHAHKDGSYESEPAERLREEASALLKDLDDIIVKLPDRNSDTPKG